MLSAAQRAIGEGAVFQRNILNARRFVVDVQSHGDIRKRGIADENVSGGVAVNRHIGIAPLFGVKGAVLEDNVDAAFVIDRVGEVDAVHVLAVFKIQVDRMVRIPLAPGRDAVEVIHPDGDVLIQKGTGLALIACVAVKHVSIDFHIALAAGHSGSVSVDDDIIRHMPMREGTHVGAGFAIQLRHASRLAHVHGRERISQGFSSASPARSGTNARVMISASSIQILFFICNPLLQIILESEPSSVHFPVFAGRHACFCTPRGILETKATNGGFCMSVKRVTFAPSALAHGPRPTEREIYRRDPPPVGQGRPSALPNGGGQHG